MNIKGKVKQIGETVAVSDKFRKREIVVTIDADTKYPQHVTFQVSQDKCESLDNLKVGYEVVVEFNLKGREWNGKYFNTLEAWKVIISDASANHDYAEQSAKYNPVAKIKIDEINDLPF